MAIVQEPPRRHAVDEESPRPSGPSTPQRPPTPPSGPPRREPMGLVALLSILLAVLLAAAAFFVAAAKAGPAPVVAASGGSGATQPQAATGDAVIDTAAKPGPDWKPFDPTLAPADGATVHNVTFDIKDVQKEVAPGVTQTVWSFNGQVPGPVLRGHIGDVFNVTLKNDSMMPHSIDFHASRTSMDVNMRVINPGESLVYQFKAQYAGIWMYHCGAPPALQHIGNGMFGAVIIDPPNLAPVDKEFILIQNELYLGLPGKTGDFTKMKTGAYDAVVFNDYYNQYAFAPIKLPLHAHVRFWVMDVGPSQYSSFHIVGTIFDRVYKEGAYTLPGDGPGGSQALDLLPAQGGFVETTFDDPGMYAIVSHRFADANEGALGKIQVGDGMPSMGG